MRRLTVSGLVAAFLKLGLPAWFLFYGASVTRALWVQPELVLIDANVYIGAARALLDGGNPWGTPYAGILFLGPPPSLVPFIPLALLGDAQAPAVAFLICAVSAVLAVRLLRLPLWWVFWPPLYFAVFVGNLDAALPALIVSRVALLGGLAVIIKVYAAIPLIGLRRWRDLGVAAILIVATAPFLQWDRFLADFPQISADFTAQAGGGYSAWPNPIALAVGAAALLLLRSPDAFYLVVPVLWPHTQFHYAALALPLAARSGAVAVGLGIPIPGVPLLTALALLLVRSNQRLASRLPTLVSGRVRLPSQPLSQPDR